MLHVHSSCENPATKAGKVHPFMLLPWKPCDMGRQGTLIYIVTMKT